MIQKLLNSNAMIRCKISLYTAIVSLCPICVCLSIVDRNYLNLLLALICSIMMIPDFINEIYDNIGLLRK